MKCITLLTFAFIIGLPVIGHCGLVIWNNGAGDSTWSSGGNWSTGNMPGSTDDVQIGTQPSMGIIGVDTGTATIQSLAFNNTLTGPVEVTLNSVDTLRVNGALLNHSTFAVNFSLPVTAGASAVYGGSSGSLSFVSLDVQNFALSTTGSVTVFSNLIFSLNNPSSYGHILGALDVSGATISFNASSYMGALNDTFDFSSTNFNGATLNLSSLPLLSAGLAWDTDDFIGSGLLTIVAVPEPATGMLLLVLPPLLSAVWLRKSRRCC